MPDFSSVIPETYTNVSSGFVDTLIQTQREQLFTGLMHLRCPSGDHLVLSFLDGVAQTLYRSQQENIEVIARQSWSAYLDCSATSVGFLTLSLEALRLLRVMYEAPIVHVAQLNLSAGDLSNNAKVWIEDTSPSVVHLQTVSFNRFYLIAGCSTPIIEELTLQHDRAQFSVNDESFPHTLSQDIHRITRYVSDNRHEIWQEQGLRFAFNSLIRMWIIRFSELAGRVLTERLCDQLSDSIRTAGWNLVVNTNGVSNHQYFESLDEARHVYLEIVRNFNQLASPAIGFRLSNSLARDSLLKLNPYHRTLLQRHIYDLYDFESAAVRSGGLKS